MELFDVFVYYPAIKTDDLWHTLPKVVLILNKYIYL